MNRKVVGAMLGAMHRSRRSILTGEPPRRSVATIAVPELIDKLERTKLALEAAKRAPQSKAARVLVEELKQEIRTLERDLA